MISNDFKKLCKDHNLKIWYEETKKRWCIWGQAGNIARCLKATRATHIIIKGEKYEIDEVTHQIYQLTDIKIAFEKLIF